MPVLQRLKPRDGPVVTLTLSNPSATSVAYVTLGGGQGTLSTAVPETQTPTSSSSSSSSSSMAPTYVTPAPAGGSNSSGLTQDQIGAILGSIVGFIVLLLMVWFCCGSGGRGERERRDRWYGSRSSSSSSGRSSSSSSSTDRRRRRRRRSRRRSRRPMAWTRHQPTVRVREYVGPGPGPSGWKLNPPPTRIPPTPRAYGYAHNPNPQIRGVRRYP